MKICNRCKLKKNVADFRSYFSKSRGYTITRSICISCDKEYNKKRYSENVEKIRAATMNWFKNNPDRNRENKRKFYHANKERINAKRSAEIHKTRDKKREYDKKYCTKNADRKRKWAKEYQRKRRTILSYRILQNLRGRIWSALNGLTKSDRTKSLIGCSVEQLKLHLESKFNSEMSWDNYGSYWQVDHIKPCALFDLSDSQQQKECFNFKNLQPLERIENIKKGKKYAT